MPGRDHWSIGIGWFPIELALRLAEALDCLHPFETHTKILQMESFILVVTRLKLRTEYSSQLVIALDYSSIDQT